MSNSKAERIVKSNALKLDKKMGDFSQNVGQYVVFNGKDHFFSDSFGVAVNQGGKVFGNESGFVVRKVGVTPTLSNLVKE